MASPKHHHRAAAAAAAASSAAPTTTKQNHHAHAAAAAAARLPQKRQKQHRPLLLRRAMLHSCLCFLLGLLVGLAPSDWTDAASRAAADANTAATGQVFRALHAVRAMANNHSSSINTAAAAAFRLSRLMTIAAAAAPPPTPRQQQPDQLVVVVTTTTGAGGGEERERRSAGLTRTAHALRLVSPPLVWLVVEAAREAGPTALLLRRTAGAGVAYRHLTYKDNFTSEEWQEERHHQRNVALAHVEHHRLRGVLLFAGLADVYDLRLLDHLRHIRTVGAWTVATVWEQEKRVAVEGPVVCTTTTSSTPSATAAAAWFSSTSDNEASAFRPAPPLMSHSSVHGFAFATHLLWDPTRWDRFPTSEPDHSQDSIKFVQRLVMEEYNKTRVIPDYSNCSQILVWRVDTMLF